MQIICEQLWHPDPLNGHDTKLIQQSILNHESKARQVCSFHSEPIIYQRFPTVLGMIFHVSETKDCHLRVKQANMFRSVVKKKMRHKFMPRSSMISHPDVIISVGWGDGLLDYHTQKSWYKKCSSKSFGQPKRSFLKAECGNRFCCETIRSSQYLAGILWVADWLPFPCLGEDGWSTISESRYLGDRSDRFIVSFQQVFRNFLWTFWTFYTFSPFSSFS